MTTSPTPPPPLVVGPVTRTDFVRYQGASGDMNPIHHDEEYAKAAGFPTPFAVGMFQAGVLATYATDWLGASNVRGFRIRFSEQVWPGDTLVCSGGIESEGVSMAGEPIIVVKLTCLRQGGGTAVTAWATFVKAEQPVREQGRG